MANINALFATLARSWAVPMDSKHTEASFFAGFVMLMSRSDAYISTSGDFVVTTTTTDITKLIAIPPCACARCNNQNSWRLEVITSGKDRQHIMIMVETTWWVDNYCGIYIQAWCHIAYPALDLLSYSIQGFAYLLPFQDKKAWIVDRDKPLLVKG